MGACVTNIPSQDSMNGPGRKLAASCDNRASMSRTWPKCPVHSRNGSCAVRPTRLPFVLPTQRLVPSSMEPFMSQYRRSLPQLADRNFITDGGLETTLIYHDGIDLPY